MNGYACRLDARRRPGIARAGVHGVRVALREKESMDMIWSWFSFMAGIGASSLVCLIVGAILTWNARVASEASD